MKFRCRMIDVTAMRDFTNIVSIISKIAKQCILRITTEEISFNIGCDSIPVLWVELSQSHFFIEYIMSGVSEKQNEIYLECEAAMLARSLSSLRLNSKSVKIKLTNKLQPCLTFEMELSSSTVESRQCVHDVPVRVVPRKEWTTYKVPNISEFDISIDMPLLKNLRNIVERMRNMSSHLTLTADKTGMFILKVETDSANVSANFPGLQVWSCSQVEDRIISATIDAKKLLIFLAWDIVHPNSVRCNIIENKIVNLFLDLAGYLKVRYFVPAITV
ncbi:PREDICTED: checkpoint protein HUS1 [Polistes dominula]|uniref:Checkpoint protein n=1 Tax=Polistes dominula TaxID=743375 RepID=A0ABM1J0L1_POLDO|nr:PREDICTED: checkpoint protein HUS1 [Polistes dominula]